MGSVVKSVGSTLFGTGSNAGVLGTGQYKAQNYTIDKSGVNNASVGSDTNQQQSREQQVELAKALELQAQGKGPSVVQDQLKAATDRTVSQAAGAAASSRGVNPAVAARTALMAQAQTNQEAANQSAQLKAQEQLSGQNQLATALANQRTQDINVADSDRAAKLGLEQLGVQQQTGISSINSNAYNSASQRRGDLIGGIGSGLAAMSDEENKVDVSDGTSDTKSMLNSIGSGVKVEDTSGQSQKKSGGSGDMMAMVVKMAPMIASAMSDEKNKTDVKSGTTDTKAMLKKIIGGVASSKEGSSSNKSGHTKMGEGVGKGIASLFGDKKDAAGGTTDFSKDYLAMSDSDENKKTDIEPGTKELRAFVDAIKAHKYEYKKEFKDDPLAGEGEFISPMAQELEKSKLGKTMVKDTPNGKVVDYGKGFGTILASQAMLNERLSDIEKALTLKKGKK